MSDCPSREEAIEYTKVYNILKKQGIKISIQKWRQLKKTWMLVIIYPEVLKPNSHKEWKTELQ